MACIMFIPAAGFIPPAGGIMPGIAPGTIPGAGVAAVGTAAKKRR